MASQKFSTIKLPDEDLITALVQITGEFPEIFNQAIGFQFGESGATFSVKIAELLTDPLLADVRSARAALLHRVDLNGQGYSIILIRGAGADEVSANFPDQNRPGVLSTTAKFLSSTHRHLRAYGRTAATDEVLGREMSEFYRQREELLTRLENVQTKIIETNEQYRERLDQHADERRRELDAEHQQKAAELEVEYKRKQDDLARRSEDLQKRISALDDRSSTHARRQVREELKKILSERATSFSLSKDTIKKRLPIHALFIVLIAGSGTLFALALLGYLPTAPGLGGWFAVVRLPVIGLALAAAIIFYIRWADHWFRQHADEEMRLKRLELDIDRATWVVEMTLEWTREKGAEIPKELVDRLSRNLFEVETHSRPRHPSEDLASALLGASSGLTLNLPGVAEAKFDRKGIRQLKDTVDEK